jgi:hypothetical protein
MTGISGLRAHFMIDFPAMNTRTGPAPRLLCLIFGIALIPACLLAIFG